ncbi:MAG: bifunctional folylpolyglutamate synthase/dihydrofolate synthase, partial [Thermodesulfobacteriota bacterium]|nr:bifunctional folylpolyglutamate synthase/dihydrofolate synthase [Thermodesulfobacteriota bacterium]
DLDRIAPLAKGLTQGKIYVPGLAGISRARPPEDLAQALGPRAVAVPDVKEALERVRGIKGWVVVCGSLYLLAEFFKLRPECLRE